MARLEVLAAQLGLSPQAGGAKGVEHAEVEMCAAVLVSVVEGDDPLHQGLELGQVRDGVPVARVRLHPARPGGAEPIEGRKLFGVGLGQETDELVVAARGRLAERPIALAEGPLAVAAGARGESARPLRIVDESPRVGTVEPGARKQQPLALGTRPRSARPGQSGRPERRRARWRGRPGRGPPPGGRRSSRSWQSSGSSCTRRGRRRSGGVEALRRAEPSRAGF